MEWISVKDKLPPKKRVLGFSKHGIQIVGYCHVRKNGEVELQDEDWFVIITHWMPLPEPPKN